MASWPHKACSCKVRHNIIRYLENANFWRPWNLRISAKFRQEIMTASEMKMKRTIIQLFSRLNVSKLFIAFDTVKRAALTNQPTGRNLDSELSHCDLNSYRKLGSKLLLVLSAVKFNNITKSSAMTGSLRKILKKNNKKII